MGEEMARNSDVQADRLVSAAPYGLLLLLTVVNALNFVDRNLLASFANYLKPELNLTDTQFGLLTGALPQIFGQPEAEKLFSSLSKGPALTKSEAATALAKVNLDELSNNGQLVIPLGVFLLAIADTYHYLLREYVLNAQSLLSSYGWKNVTLENFTQFVNGAGIKASPAAVQSWYDEARGSQPTLTPEGALTTLSKFPLTLGQPLVPAELSAAAVIMLLQETTTRKTVTTVTTVTKKVKVIKKK